MEQPDPLQGIETVALTMFFKAVRGQGEQESAWLVPLLRFSKDKAGKFVAGCSINVASGAVYCGSAHSNGDVEPDHGDFLHDAVV